MLINPHMLAAFSPLNVPGCGLWLEADRGITRDASVRAAAEADLSGYARSCSQATDYLRPAYAAAGMGGRPALSFTLAISPYLTNTTLSGLDNLTKATFLTVFRIASLATAQCVFNFQNELLRIHQVNSGILQINLGASGQYVTIAQTSTDPMILLIVFDGSLSGDTNRAKVWVNGAAQTFVAHANVPAALPTTTGYTVGRHYTGSLFFGGEIAVPLAMWPGKACGAGERQYLTYGYGRKYGTSVTL